jgi:metallo-beta-lactamase family protein
MKLTFVGAAHEVTGSCHYLYACKKHILIDCGMEQGQNLYENVEIPVDEALIDYVLLTHAHIDHSGLIPLLYARGFRGKVFASEATVDLCNIMLRDSAHIQMFEAEWRNRKAKRSSGVSEYVPLYNMQDADGAIKCLVPCHYGKKVQLCEGIEVCFNDVGHLLGSAAIEVWVNEPEGSKKIVFSGDIGNLNQPLIKNPGLIKEADYVVMESTYGDRYHDADRVDYVTELTALLQETFDKGGNVVIPSFAVGRTQEMLYFLRKIKAERLVHGHEHFKVYVDSPLAVEATNVFNKNIYECFDEEAMQLVNKGINPISFGGLSLSITSDESKSINFDEEPKVILSASGMCEAGRIRHHLKHNLWREECTVLFVGYQAIGTLGRSLVEGAKEVKLFGETVEVRAKVTSLKGLSGHADKGGLTDWINGFEKQPERVFIVHGDDTVCDEYADYLHEHFGFDTYAPYSGTCFDLQKNECIYEAEGVRVAPKKAKAAAAVFDRLVAAGQRLMAVIFKNEGVANKDLAKFADQINSLSDKWDRDKQS